ncbi:MAG TPA: PLP-dependent transferase, partial [Spirochaetia bacterium]|nr:PLP-dependent transferase [Spirochaetia bacterium]
MDQSKFNLGTLAVHGGQEADAATGARAVPIYSTVAYNFKDTAHAARLFALEEFGNIYSRIMNPTCDVLEKRLAALEGGVMALSFSSGMSAITAAVLTLTHSGQNFISATSLYGGTWTAFTQTLPKLGVEVRLFDPSHPEEIARLADSNTRCVYIESVGNPKNDIPDFEKIAGIAHSLGLPLLVDNTVLTPVLFKPLEHGADIVVYSTTKYIGGHGVHVGGAVVDGGRFDWTADPGRWKEFTGPDPSYHGMVFTEALKSFGNIAYIVHMRTHWLRDMGACMSPFAAFLFLQGLETLHLRMPRHVENAQKVAEWLGSHPAVKWVNYP